MSICTKFDDKISIENYILKTSHNHIVEFNDPRLKTKKFDLNTILNNFGDLQKKYYKNLEKGNYHIINNIYITTDTIKTSSNVVQEIEYSYSKGCLFVYSYSETKKDNDEKIKSYKFINFANDGKTISNIQENYLIKNQRLEIHRNSEGEILEIIEETGKEANAFHTTSPTSIIKKDGNGTVLEHKEWKYDNSGQITTLTYINKNGYYQIEYSYLEDLIISNYKNLNNQIYWNRIFNSKIGKHTSESLFDNKGKLICEEKFTYNQNGDLKLRINKNASGEILSSKEIQYDESNAPIYIINRGKNGILKSTKAIA